MYFDRRSFERALDCLVRALMFDPKNWMTLTALSLTYLRLGANEMAAQTLESALAIRPTDASILSSLGEIHREGREYEAAQTVYRQALNLDPAVESAAVGLALCLLALGQSEEAAGILSDAYGRGHRSLNLLHVMTTLPKNTIPIDVLDALEHLSTDNGAMDATSKNSYLFARAAALDHAGRYAEAWQTLVAANRPLAVDHQSELKANIARRERSLGWICSASPKAFRASSDGPISLFILGPSRSGKTSLERLVGSLFGVKAGYEAPIVENAIRRTCQMAAIPPVNSLDELPPGLIPSFREVYLESLVLRAGSARVFTNTLPGRIHDAGLMVTAVPNVRYLLVKRSSDDVALRIYMTKYLSGNAYAYDLRAIRDYVNWYNMMIDLIAEKLPDVTRVLDYDGALDDPYATLQRVGELCGLSVARDTMPVLGNDRGCAKPYKEFMNAQ